MKWLLLIVTVFIAVTGFFFTRFQMKSEKNIVSVVSTIAPTLSLTLTPAITLIKPPTTKVLANDYHVYQSFNNCGPAALSMALSYYGIKESQQTLGNALRPYQNPQGDNDDKSVTLAELAEKAHDYNLESFHRTNGSIDRIKLFLAYDLPVITRTWLHENEDIGHYRVVKGYDDTTGEIIQDDSMQGPNMRFTYQQFNNMWDKFGYEYVVLVPKEKVSIVKEILGENYDEKKSWEKSLTFNENILKNDPENVYARFNLSVALYYLGNFQQSVTEFEKIEHTISSRTLWYQIEPIQSYEKLGNFERVMQLTDEIITHENRAFSELYIIRGDMMKNHGDSVNAKIEYEKAILYNQNLQLAKERMNGL